MCRCVCTTYVFPLLIHARLHVCSARLYTLIDALHEHAYVYTGVLAFNISMVFMSVSTSLCMCSCTRRKGYVSYLYRQEYGAPGHPGPWWVPFKFSCHPASFGRFRGIYISSRIPFRAPPTLHWSAQCLGVPNWVPKVSFGIQIPESGNSGPRFWVKTCAALLNPLQRLCRKFGSACLGYWGCSG